jgi:DNA-binding HxlR family transcriptional regulator
MPAKPDFGAMHCSVARSLNVIGEGWTLLILRDIFGGRHRFDELQKSLGIATNVLTARLKQLTEEGILEQRRYQEHPPRFEYILTEKGRDLGPLLLQLVAWGNKHLAGSNPPQALVHKDCAHEMTPQTFCSHCGERIARGSATIVPSSQVKTVTAALRKQLNKSA